MQRAVLSWIGGKSRLVEKLVPLIPIHRCYCEVFAGAAWLLFNKPESKSEVINDINLDLVTLYRVIQNHLDEFVRYFRWALVSRDEFDRLASIDPRTMTDIQRSARFYYLVKCGFGAKIKSPSFGISTHSASRLNLLRLEEELSQAHLRLARVTVENRGFAEIVRLYDRPETFFYVDPPYYGSENDYGAGLFARGDFDVLSELLEGCRGRFLLSINDTPETRAIFGRFHVRTVGTRYSAGRADRGAQVRELLVMNYRPPAAPKGA